METSKEYGEGRKSWREKLIGRNNRRIKSSQLYNKQRKFYKVMKGGIVNEKSRTFKS